MIRVNILGEDSYQRQSYMYAVIIIISEQQQQKDTVNRYETRKETNGLREQRQPSA